MLAKSAHSFLRAYKRQFRKAIYIKKKQALAGVSWYQRAGAAFIAGLLMAAVDSISLTNMFLLAVDDKTAIVVTTTIICALVLDVSTIFVHDLIKCRIDSPIKKASLVVLSTSWVAVYAATTALQFSLVEHLVPGNNSLFGATEAIDIPISAYLVCGLLALSRFGTSAISFSIPAFTNTCAAVKAAKVAVTGWTIFYAQRLKILQALVEVDKVDEVRKLNKAIQKITLSAAMKWNEIVMYVLSKTARSEDELLAGLEAAGRNPFAEELATVPIKSNDKE